jgi:hypothetical protein
VDRNLLEPVMKWLPGTELHRLLKEFLLARKEAGTLPESLEEQAKAWFAELERVRAEREESEKEE